MSFQKRILEQGRNAVRPASVPALLLHPVSDDPSSPADNWVTTWLAEHALQQRFYVGGLDWFLSVTSMTVDDVLGYREDIGTELPETWTKIPGTPGIVKSQLLKSWGPISKPQFYAARNRQPLLFPKAALIILTCELALADQLRRRNEGRAGKPIEDGITSAGQIYQHMGIVPACWNIDSFGQQYLKDREAADPHFVQALADKTEQTTSLVTEMSTGFTVTFETATAIRDLCSNGTGAPVRAVRAKAGRGGLGSRKAASSEVIELA